MRGKEKTWKKRRVDALIWPAVVIAGAVQPSQARAAMAARPWKMADRPFDDLLMVIKEMDRIIG